MRNELPGENKTTNKNRNWKGGHQLEVKYRLCPENFSWRVPPRKCVQYQGQIPHYYIHLSISQAHSKKLSYTNNHSCEKFHWPVPLTPHPYSLAVCELVWLLEREGGNDNGMTIPTIPTANWQLTMRPRWRMGEEFLSQVSGLPL